MIRLLLASLFALSASLCLAQPTMVSREIPANVSVSGDIVYTRHGERELRLDLYTPTQRTEALLPIVVTITGGGVRVVDKEEFAPVAAALAARGFAALNIEYRPIVEASFPAGVEDARAAVRWARANAETHGFDAEVIGVIGGSMGGYLATYLGLTSVWKGEGSASESGTISAIVAMAPPTDFSAIKTHPTFIALLGREYADDPELWRFASAVNYVGPESPPVLLMHSASDRAVPVAQSLALASRYASANLPLELVVFPDASHAFWNHESQFDDAMARAAAFFSKHLVTGEK